MNENKTQNIFWMKFFCYWRPWISFLFMIITLINIIGYKEYQDFYLKSLLGFLILCFDVFISILLIVMFFMAKKRNKGTITLIKYILILESLYIPFKATLNNTEEAISFLLTYIITLTFTYFVWYKTNITYFTKRTHLFNETKELEERSKIKKNMNIKSKQTIFIVLIILFITNLISIALFINTNNKLKTIKKECDTAEQAHEHILGLLTKHQGWGYTMDKINFYDENIVFVIEEYGNYYYNYDCFKKLTMNQEFTYWAYNKEAAIYHGYKEGICE